MHVLFAGCFFLTFCCHLLLKENLTGGNVCSYIFNISETENSRNSMKKFNLSFFLLQNEELKVRKNVCENITSSNFVDILLLGLSPLHLYTKSTVNMTLVVVLLLLLK